jgi:hypothetical protein
MSKSRAICEGTGALLDRWHEENRMQFPHAVQIGFVIAGVALATGTALAAAPGPKLPGMAAAPPKQPPGAAMTPPPSSTLHCRKGQCNARDIKVIVDDRARQCTLKIEYDTITVNAGNRGLNNQGVKLRWVLDETNAKNRWFFYPGGVKPARNDGAFTDDGPDEAKKTYGLTDLNNKEEEISTKYTVLVMDKDRKARCSGEATVVNKGGAARKRKH